MHWPEKYITYTEKFSTEDFFKHFHVILVWTLQYFISVEFPQNIMPYDKKNGQMQGKPNLQELFS